MVNVWAADITPLLIEEIYRAYYNRVPKWRKEKADKLRNVADRARSVGAWILWEKIQEMTGLPEDAVFNLSHSGKYVLCACSDREGVQVGCDVEMTGALRMSVAERYFCPSECKIIRAGTDEKEQAELEQSIKACREQLTQYDEDTDRTEEFLALVHKYTDITELTPVIINEFVDKILVHKAEKIDGERVMEIEIYLNFIGKVELPAQELTEEELAAIKEKQRLRERNAMYQRRRRAKFMPKTKAIRAKVQEAEIKEALENASAKAEKLLMADNDAHIAEVVAGENKVYVDTGIFPTAEEVKEKYAI